MRLGFGAGLPKRIEGEFAPDPLNLYLARAQSNFDTLPTQIRLWWEKHWGQPTRGNPLWEDVPLAEHIESMFEQQLAKGNVPIVVDGAIFLTENKEKGIVWKELEDGRRRLVKQQETDEEWVHRMIEHDLADQKKR
jgi:hypothetical protein